MPLAFVLLNADLGAESNLVEEMRKIQGVKEAYTVYGVYDILLKVEAESMEKLKDFISDSVRKVKGVKSTLTMLIMDG